MNNQSYDYISEHIKTWCCNSDDISAGCAASRTAEVGRGSGMGVGADHRHAHQPLLHELLDCGGHITTSNAHRICR